MLHPATLLHPAIIIHGADDARTVLAAALAAGRQVVLLSAPGAGCYGGARWWRVVVDGAVQAAPGALAADIVDCGTEAGRAVEALRERCRLVVLDPANRAFADIAARAASIGAVLLPAPPPALDIGMKDAVRALARWLDAGGDAG